jgi:16S rRNA (guanine527-N7)-methyltransferase
LSLSLEQDLILGADALGLALTHQQTSQLLAYIEMLQKWNQVYNLTAIKDPQQMLTQHVLDCLAVVTPLKEMVPNAQNLLDVGAGGGLPSVVLAIACPSMRVVAVDAVAKKSAFIETVAHTLKLSNLKGIHSRVELLENKFDLVVSRAFASLKDFTAWSDKALRTGGKWAAMKGKVPEEEMAELPPNIQIQGIQTLNVPDLEARRCLIWLQRSPA